MTHERLVQVAVRLRDARLRAQDATRQGDNAGAAYARAEARRLRAILEGASL